MTWELLEKSGNLIGGWDYNEANLEYNQIRDVDTSTLVAYNYLGEPSSWININKT